MQIALSQRLLAPRRFVRAVLTVGCLLAGALLTAGLLLAPRQAVAAADEGGFEPIFNGKSLDGWDGNPKFWSVKEGAIVGEATAGNLADNDTFCIWRPGTVDDFVLRMKIKITGDQANSGVQYRSSEFEKWRVGGYQADWDHSGSWVGTLYEQPGEHGGRGQLARAGDKVVIEKDGTKQKTSFAKLVNLINNDFDPDEWNELEITAQGNHLTHKVNGKLFMECIDNEEAKRSLSGIVALQIHAGRVMKVEFKEIGLKRLKP
ncbi:MAG TPA: DUF1080 domain-containing protein [Pirellulales bacterium]|jgi:hypothetical protein|nr:DUF1080 domain-containing protein [Pirellulales bacterium]